jgi:hypothetical protein
MYCSASHRCRQLQRFRERVAAEAATLDREMAELPADVDAGLDAGASAPSAAAEPEPAADVSAPIDLLTDTGLAASAEESPAAAECAVAAATQAAQEQPGTELESLLTWLSATATDIAGCGFGRGGHCSGR